VERAGDRVDVLVETFRPLEVPVLAALVSPFDFVAVGADFVAVGVDFVAVGVDFVTVGFDVRFFFAGAAEPFDFSADAFCRKRRWTFRISATNSSFLSPCQPGTP
jgi:hypothetical protein